MYLYFLKWDTERKTLAGSLRAVGVPVWVIVADSEIPFENDAESARVISPEHLFRFSAGKLYPAVQS
ncbi:MAG: hypothetical protein HC887_10025 [Desulfobacteraceae bacterium]|nr:hypothetical protein [Desulfobacteraceae bacterium]